MSNKATGSPLASRSPLNVVLAGYGAVGRLMHAPLIRHVDGLNLYAIVSSRPAAVYADYPGMCVPESLDRALADPQVDMVVIATPNDSHAPLGLQVLTAGRHLVIDKPATLDAGQARELATEAHARGLMFSVFHNRRWDADFLTLSRLVAKGTPGPLSRCHLYYDRFRPEVQDRWRERPGPGSGSWFDLGAHLIDQALLLFGPPEAVWVDLAALREGGEAVDHFKALLRYPSLRVTLESHALAAENGLRYALDGRRASYRKYGLDTQEQNLRDGGVPGQSGWGHDPRPGTLTYPDGRTETVENERGDYRCFYQNVEAHLVRGEALAVTPSQVIEVMRVIDAGLESSRRRCEVAL